MKLIWFCAAGYSFFVGTGSILLAILLSVFRKKLWSNLVIYALTFVGAFLIFLSATPLPIWFYIAWTAGVIAWLLLVALRVASKSAALVCIVPASLSLMALFAELPFHLMPSVPQEGFERLYIIGDSVTAGIGGVKEQTWPKILRKKYGVDIVDLAESGATVASAMRQAAQVDSPNAIVLLEIGGNDHLAPTPHKLFEQSLRRLLKTVSNPKRRVVMLELPLLPWHIEYGRIQRRLAKEFNATLIPKRFFVSVVSSKDATPDLGHLSASGHKLMAKAMWSLLGDSLKKSSD